MAEQQTDLTDAIATSAAGPAKASDETGSIEQHSLTDLIEADRYLASKAAAKRRGLGIRYIKNIPPGND